MTSDFDEGGLRRAIQQRLPDYYPEYRGCGVTLELIRSRCRRFSHTYLYSIDGADDARQLFVKVPIEAAAQRRANDDQSPHDRPRLIPVLSVEEEVSLEYTGLTRMREYFSTRSDPRLDTPRVLDLLQHAIVVEGIPFPTLLQTLARHRGPIANDRLEPFRQAFFNTGVWLRTFHEIPAGPEAPKRLVRRDEIADAVSRYTHYLSCQTGACRDLDRISASLNRQLHEELPGDLPLVSGHGDFGLHNVFVADNQRVIGFDTLAHWQTSPYEDISYFLLLLETIPPLFPSRTWTMSASTVSVAREAFLAGYFGERNVPERILMVFDVLVSLDKWASAVHSCRNASGLRGGMKRCRLTLQQRWLRSRIEEALRRFVLDPTLSRSSDAV